MRHPSAIVAGVRRPGLQGLDGGRHHRAYRMPGPMSGPSSNRRPSGPARLIGPDPTDPRWPGHGVSPATCPGRLGRRDRPGTTAPGRGRRRSRRRSMPSHRVGPGYPAGGRSVATTARPTSSRRRSPRPRRGSWPPPRSRRRQRPRRSSRAIAGIGGRYLLRPPRAPRAGNAALSDADAEVVRQLRAHGVARQDVADRFGVSPATITRITRGETYRPGDVAEVDQVVTIEPEILRRAPNRPSGRSRHAAVQSGEMIDRPALPRRRKAPLDRREG